MGKVMLSLISVEILGVIMLGMAILCVKIPDVTVACVEIVCVTVACVAVARRGNSGHVQGRSRIHVGRRDDSAWRERGVLDDISDRSRRRRGTTPIVLYDENSTEEHKSNPSRIHQHPRTSVSSQQQRQRLQEQQRKRRRDKYATRRDR
ncbi:unnamed protein product [Peronospora belbahrii]|uniref:Secreted protein n=1 Tax=Peronospora belbahrii TaxID=622444 RepID=A0AAU9KWP8_9STRA|nr:unnamed protein product [Peronospora belbahrii]